MLQPDGRRNERVSTVSLFSQHADIGGVGEELSYGAENSAIRNQPRRRRRVVRRHVTNINMVDSDRRQYATIRRCPTAAGVTQTITT